MHAVLTAAIELHQSGQLEPASRLYQKVLANQNQNADALHLLGVLHHQQGNPALAVELITRAVAFQPNVPVFHANLAEAYRALGQLERAFGCCRTALRLCPEYPEALCNLGLALIGLRRPSEAVEHFRRALELRPGFAMAHNNLGMARRELGQGDLALAQFLRAVELAPASASARTNLGQMLLDRGEAEEALPHCQEAVRLEPNLSATHHNLGNVFAALGRFVEARSAYLEALRLDPDLALAHAQMGSMLRRQGQLEDALPWLRQATELAPNNASFWENLAESYSDEQDYFHAISCWQRVLALAPETGPVHISLGWALHEEGLLTEAGEHYRSAVRLQPNSATAQLHLGGMHEEQGAMAEAEAAFRKAIKLQPSYALPHARLATLLRGKLPDADRMAMEQRLADPKLGRGYRSRMLFGLAHVLDARDDFAGAAHCLREANALTRELSRGRRDYEPADHERFVDNLVRAFSPDFFAATRGKGSDARRPVFVFGLPRSGTTLIEQVLASHPRIHGAGELRLARQSLEAIPNLLGRSDAPLDCVPGLGAAVLELGDRHLDALGKLDAGRAARVVDKMPDNYLYLGLLAAMFPNAVFIHCRRDLRDVAVSCWMTDFRSIRWANKPEHIASRFGQYSRLMDHWKSVLPVTIHELHYEDTVTDLEGVARRLLTACGQEWDPACLEFHRTQRPVRTASVAQVRQPVYRRSLARWKNYEHELAELFAALPISE
jgi:tetratricopeptide (TPR) repeat protein